MVGCLWIKRTTKVRPLFVVHCFLGSRGTVFATSRLLREVGSRVTRLRFIHAPRNLCTPIACILSVNKGEVHPMLVLVTCGLCQRSVAHVFGPTAKVRICRGCALLRSSLVSRTSHHHNGRAMRGI